MSLVSYKWLSFYFNSIIKLHPLKKRFFIKCIPNKHIIELDITFDCNLLCNNCDRGCGIAPSKDYMTLQQVQKFINESLKLNWHWKEIYLLGGEPLLHPEILEICNLLETYKNKNPRVKIGLCTNGYSAKITQKIKSLPSFIDIINSQKKSPYNSFFKTVNVAPKDLQYLKDKDFSKGCFITEMAGVALNRYGYYPCAAGGAVDRIFGFDVGIKALENLTSVSLDPVFNQLCGYCGHFKRGTKDISKTQQISSSWRKAIKTYLYKQPILTIY